MLQKLYVINCWHADTFLVLLVRLGRSATSRNAIFDLIRRVFGSEAKIVLGVGFKEFDSALYILR